MNGISSSPDRDAARSMATGSETPLDRFAAEARARYVRRARRWIRRLQIDAVGLAPEGAYQAAWVLLCEDIQDGRVEDILTREAFDRVFLLRFLKALFDERRRQRAKKRGWGAVAPLSEHEDEVIDPHGGDPGRWFEDQEWVDRILDRLDRHGASLREILSGKVEGRTHAELAAALGVSVTSIERRCREIREILGAAAGGEA